MLWRHASRRLLHSSSVLRQVSDSPASLAATQVKSKLGQGKKKPPQKQSFVILNASQSRLLNRKKRVPSKISSEDTTLNDDERRKLRELSSQLNMLPTSTTLTPEELVQTMEALKPDASTISDLRYQQVRDDINVTFTQNQIATYIKTEYPESRLPRRTTKHEAIDIVIKLCWGITVSPALNGQEDLITKRVFDLSKKEMFLLLSQPSIIQNWVRANVKILVLPASLQLMVRAPEAHVQYIELSMANLFKRKNVKTYEVNLEELSNLFKMANEELPSEEIQQLTAVFFEQKETPEGVSLPNEYVMSSLGNKKFDRARRLMLWALDYKPFSETYLHADLENEKYKLFKQFPDSSLPWIYRKKSWLRLREPRTAMLPVSKPKVEFDQDKVYDELFSKSPKEGALSVTAVAFGQILFNADKLTKHIMNTNIPFAHERIHKLPLLEPQEDEAEDPHIYHVQIKLVPSTFNGQCAYTKAPPVEFWIEMDQDYKASMDTFQALCVTREITSSVALPSHPTDMKFVRSETEYLTEPYDEQPETWLDSQPGIKTFFEHAVLDFSGNVPVKVPQYCDLMIPGHDEPVRYDYVNMTHRKQVDLKFKDRMLTFAVLEGGVLGGRTTEVVMVGKDEGVMDKSEFEAFVRDCKEFVEELA